MNSATRTFLALVAGIALGAAVRAFGTPELVAAGKLTAPIGALWLAALKMTLVPLIFSLIVSGVSSWSGAHGGGGRLIGRTLALFAGLLVIAAVIGTVATTLILQVWPVRSGALEALAQRPASGPPPEVPGIVDQIVGMIPTNPIGAAADGAMAPLVIFALLFAIALGRGVAERRDAFLLAIQAVGDAMMQIVGWVLALAPIGVFVLALNIALSTGLETAGVLFQAMLVMTLAPTFGIAFVYFVARIGGGVSFVRFARAAIGPQAVAAGTTSSMATLPALIEAAERKLDMPPALAGSVLPLAVSTFRFGNVLIVMSLAIFASYAVGHQPTLVELAAAGVAAILTNIGIPGLPAIAVLYAADAPAFQAMGAPLELLPLLIAVSAPSDIMDTVCNVTADLAAATVVQRWFGGAAPAPDA